MTSSAASIRKVGAMKKEAPNWCSLKGLRLPRMVIVNSGELESDYAYRQKPYNIRKWHARIEN